MNLQWLRLSEYHDVLTGDLKEVQSNVNMLDKYSPIDLILMHPISMSIALLLMHIAAIKTNSEDNKHHQNTELKQFLNAVNCILKYLYQQKAEVKQHRE